ncbi:MAG: SH3 domain-containing protein [Planctomycetia bacterium]|nr:SH3 domain-containing protein [Planctomycetia bacterium]
MRNVWTFFGILLGQAALVFGQFPYTATVCEDGAMLRSGPGTNYYATDTCRNGDTVEVYRHTFDGWCAVRPPAGSYSWVAARYVQHYDGDLARVVGDRVPCYVGSRITQEKTASQVSLASGKVLEILAAPNGDTEAWYKVSPPSGEFRYIHGKFLTPNRTGVTTLPDAQVSELPSLTAAASGPVASPVDVPDVTLPKESAFQNTFNQLDADLSYILSTPDASRWETEDLLLRVNRLMNQAETLDQRNRTEALRKKVLDADKVRKSRIAFNNLSGNRPGGGVVTGSSGSCPRVSTPGRCSRFAQPFSTTPGRWDYQGILVRVQPQTYRDLTLPKYALMDEHGLVRCFVTTTAIDLAPYEGKAVALAGTRNYLKDQRTFNLNVKQVVNGNL